MEKLLLFILNKWFAGGPVRYGRINNIDAYERSFLDETLKMNPEITMKKFLEDMDKMDKCLKSREGCIIKGGTIYKGDDLLYEELT